MSKLRLTIATGDYDHTRDLASGRVAVEGIELNYLTLPIEEIFYRFTAYREWDVSEMSLGKYVSMISSGDTSLVSIPVFPSRVFRQSSVFVRPDGAVKQPKDLRGCKVGVPEWAQTASIYTRGWLTHTVGVPLAEIDWYQGGVNDTGRKEKVKLKLPNNVRYTPVPDRSLTEMLITGDLDAIMTAHPPQPFKDATGEIIQLLPDHRQFEADYYRETRIFPIMHTTVIRRDVFECDPWIARNLLAAFEHAKANSIRRATDLTASRFPIPWAAAHACEYRALLGEDYFAYGVEPNRRTLDAFLQYAHEQGVCHRRLEVADLFLDEVLGQVAV